MSAREYSYVKLPNGDTLQVFTIKHFAESIGRSQITIRRWERLGIIPNTFFVNERGFRMYSQEQIDVVVKILKEVGYFKKSSGLLNTDFSPLCHQRWGELKIKYLSNEKGI